MSPRFISVAAAGPSLPLRCGRVKDTMSAVAGDSSASMRFRANDSVTPRDVPAGRK